MCLESIYAIKGRSSSEEPISQYGIDDVRKGQIAVKHGYQLGADQIGYFLDNFWNGHIHDPVRAYNESNDDFKSGNFSILSLSDSSLSTSGHAVLPYKWIDSPKGDTSIIWIANPNHPVYEGLSNDSPGNIITIDKSSNEFTFQMQGGLNPEIWKGEGSMYP